MIEDEGRLFVLALWLLPGLGPVRFRRLLHLAGGPEEVFSLPDEALREAGVRGALRAALRRKDAALRRAREEAQALAHLGAGWVALGEEGYPALLAEIPDPPGVLFYLGRLSPGPYPLAVIGSRSASSYGRRVTLEWTEELARAGLDIVSGLALGVDALAHEAALRAGGYTVAVLGSGLDRVAPRSNLPLARRIVEAGGAVVTEFPLGTPPRPGNFPLRNRIISGLSLGVLVVEAGPRSGTLITARLAAEQGREVMVVPGSVYSHRSQGTHRLIREGATLVDSPARVLEELGLELAAGEEPSRESLTLSPEEAKVLDRLEVYPVHLDDLAHRLGMEVGAVASALLALELKGLVESLPGNYYQRVKER